MQDEINLLEYLKILNRYRKFLLFFVGGVTFFSIIYSLLLPPVYQATATLMPVGGKKSSSGLALLGLGGLLGGTGNDAVGRFQVILQSRTLAERIVGKYDLVKVFFEDQWDAERQSWKVTNSKDPPSAEAAAERLRGSLSSVYEPDNTLVAVKVQNRNPELAARLANLYVQELANFIADNALTTAKKNRIFIGRQLERNKRDLLEAGKQLTDFYANGKISNIDSRLDVDVSSPFEKDSFLAEAPPGNTESPGDFEGQQKKEAALPGVPGVTEAYANIKKQKEEIENSVQDVEQKMKEINVVKNVPQQVYLQYLTLRRQLLGDLNALLTSQFETVKIDEAKEELTFQVLDWARPPKRRLKPNRRQIVMISFLAGIFFSVSFVFAAEYWKKIRTGQVAT